MLCLKSQLPTKFNGPFNGILNKYKGLNMCKDQLAIEMTKFFTAAYSLYSHFVPLLFLMFFVHSSISITLYLHVHISLALIVWFFPSFIDISLSPLALSTHPFLCLLLCHSLYSLFMAQSQSELKDHAISLRQQRSRSSRIGSWETGSPPRGGRVLGVQWQEVAVTHTLVHTHTW